MIAYGAAKKVGAISLTPPSLSVKMLKDEKYGTV
jgi:hypothetical protein